MITVELFRYQILPTNSEFSLEKLNQRADNILKELRLKIPSLNHPDFYITYDFKVLSDGLQIVVKAHDLQLKLGLSGNATTLSEFERMVIRDIKNIPDQLSRIVLRELAYETFENTSSQFNDRQNRLRKIVKSKKGKREQYEYHEQMQLVLHPDSIPNIPDSRVRKIKCMVREKLRFHAVIDQVIDPISAEPIKQKKKFKLNLKNFMDSDDFHNHIGPYMRKVERIELKVQAYIDCVTGEVEEYLLLKY